MKQYFLQYHKTSVMEYLPDTNLNDVNLVSFDQSKIGTHRIYSKKSSIQNGLNGMVFLIVGVKKKKMQYYLWSCFDIETVIFDVGLYEAYGNGFNFSNPILLNNLDGFKEFREKNGNFGLGFQNITNYDFCKTLLNFTES